MTRRRKTDGTAFRSHELRGSAPTKKSEVKITPAKERSMLIWVGKQPLSHVTVFLAQHVEIFESSQSATANPKSDI